MEERNSERKLTVWMGVGIGIAAVVAGLEQLLGLGILEPNGTAAVIIGMALSLAKMVGDYSASRPAKTMALVEKSKLPKP